MSPIDPWVPEIARAERLDPIEGRDERYLELAVSGEMKFRVLKIAQVSSFQCHIFYPPASMKVR